MIRTYLVRNSERALAERKASAASSRSTLGERILTPSAYLSECWDIYGHGTNLVSGNGRTLLMLRALEEIFEQEAKERDEADQEESDASASDERMLEPTPSTARLIANLMATYAGVPAFEEWLESGSLPQASKGEMKVLAVLRRYRELLAVRNLEEPGRAAAYLSDAMAEGVHSVTAEKLFVAPAVRSWLLSLGVDEGVLGSEVEALAPLPSSTKPTFVFTLGEAPIMAVTLEQIEEAVRSAKGPTDRIAVFCDDPSMFFQALSPVLHARGIRSAVRDSMPFERTPIGRFAFALNEAASGSIFWQEALTDLAYNPIAPCSSREAEAFNTAVRSDVLMTAIQAVQSYLKPLASLVVPALERGTIEPKELLAWLQEHAPSGPSSAGVDAFARLCEEAEDLDALPSALVCMKGATIPYSYADDALPEDTSPLVEFAGMGMLDSYAKDTLHAAILTDMSQDAFAITKANLATDSIAEKLGIKEPRTAYERKRRAFETAMQATANLFVTMAPLRRVSGNQTYPSFIYEEYVSSFDDPVMLSVDPDDLYKVPEKFADDLILVDESDVLAGFGRAFLEPERIETLATPVRGKLEALTTKEFMGLATLSDGTTHPVLSASQMELYAQCPYKWFISHEVGIHGIDEMLDARQIGTFAHTVFENTFTILADRGIHAITEESLEEALEIARTAFDDLLEEQPEKRPGHRCVAVSAEDEENLRTLRRGVLNAFRFMTLLPSGFEMSSSELNFGPDDGVVYANAVLDGRIDRVDISQNGTFAILDYKGSLKNHEAGCDSLADLTLPLHFQALVYAQALRRIPEFAAYACVGAVYLSYRAREADRFAAGSFDIAGFDIRRLMNDPKGSAVNVPFNEFLDRIEELVMPLVKGMIESSIPLEPNSVACQWCPYQFCPERR